MRQEQTMAGERADAEDDDGLGRIVWAPGEQSGDCHPVGWGAT